MRLATPWEPSHGHPPQETRPTFWTQWNDRVMPRYLMSHNPPPPRRRPETWEALLKPRLPQGDLTFMQTALWRKLPVGDRLENWLPHATQCPLYGQVETIAHALTSCRFLAPAFHIAVQCMGPAILGDTQETDPTGLLVEQPTLSLRTPLGYCLLVCSQSLMGPAQFGQIQPPPPPPPSWDLFLSMWLQVLQGWSRHPQPTLLAEETRLLHQAVKQLKETGHLQHPRVQQAGSRYPPKLHQPRRKKRK